MKKCFICCSCTCSIVYGVVYWSCFSRRIYGFWPCYRTRVVDDTNEIIEKTNGNFVATEVGDYTIADLVTPPTEEPTNPVVPEVDQPEKPSTPVEEPTTPVVEEPSTPVEVPELPIAELVTPPAPVEEPTKTIYSSRWNTGWWNSSSWKTSDPCTSSWSYQLQNL